MAYSKAKLKSSGDKASPCFRPFSMPNLYQHKMTQIYISKPWVGFELNDPSVQSAKSQVLDRAAIVTGLII
jgi:hypothetical protein